MSTIVETFPISYLPGLACRIKIKAIGDLNVSGLKPDDPSELLDESLLQEALTYDDTPFEEKPRPLYDEDYN